MMEEILDMPKPGNESKYLKRSARLYKIYVGLVALAIIASILVKLLLYKSHLIDELGILLVGLSILTIFVLAPVGLYYCWMSYKRKEENRSKIKACDWTSLNLSVVCV
jgi:hypothetical protein